jgi:TolB-like protein/class 3 adenylate cyclase/cytochrome c-type biogenesis protein CcmH/NrfG
MPEEQKSKLRLEIAHVLFIDIVGYSKLLISEQSELLEQLKEMVRTSPEAQAADSEGKLIRLATGDGMALVFRNSPESPVQCALELSRADKHNPKLQLRMGIHSGPINEITDVNDRTNVTGAGINMAQRVMDCGDAGHILLSQHVADDLEQYGQWRPLLHPLGECEVKHGMRLHVVNLYNEEIGNPEPPARFKTVAAANGQSVSDSAAPGRYPKRGLSWYELVLALLLLAGLVAAGVFVFNHRAGSSSTSAASPSAPVPDKSIAVLPFENLSEEKANAFFTDGVQDEILTDLAKIADLKVISRTSVMQYKSGVARNLRKIGEELGVAHVVEGSVQRAANKVRVNAQLIDARNDAHLWAQTYDRDLADVFAIQSEIAKTIADQLQAKLSPSEKAAIDKPPTTDLTAYDLYLRAQALYAATSDPFQAKEKLPQATRVLDEAVARDPQFLLAWCLLSKVHGDIYWGGHDHTPARLELANSAVQTALRLQPDAGEAHLALADYYYHGFRDYRRARTELAIARRTLPNNAEVFEYTGYIDRREGHWEEATRNLERALELDPRNFFTLQQMALAYQRQRRYADAARTYDRALKIVPGDPNTRFQRAAVALDERADIKPFQTMLAAVIAEDPSLAPDVDDPTYALCERTATAAARLLTNYPRDGLPIDGVNYPHAYWEGVIASWQGDSAKAQAAFSAARNEVAKIVEKQPDFAAGLSLLGKIDAGLGRKEEALREGRRACELLPISKDAVTGVALAANLAQIYAWVGEKDLAIEQIAAVERVPNLLSYGLLKLRPEWDPLRSDPRFEKIVASLAPKDK